MSTRRNSPRRTALLILLAILAAVWGLYRLKYHLSYAMDLRSRPWAYSRDPAAKLLVGRWAGVFMDPGGVEKRLEVEILLPVTDEEREKKAARRSRRGPVRFKNKQAFDGTAAVTSRLGAEAYDVYGAVLKDDPHQLSFHFTPQDENRRVLPNFTLSAAGEGRWREDTLTASLSFSHHEADGTSRSTSEGTVVDGKVVWAESPADRKIPVSLKRVPP